MLLLYSRIASPIPIFPLRSKALLRIYQTHTRSKKKNIKFYHCTFSSLIPPLPSPIPVFLHPTPTSSASNPIFYLTALPFPSPTWKNSIPHSHQENNPPFFLQPPTSSPPFLFRGHSTNCGSAVLVFFSFFKQLFCLLFYFLFFSFLFFSFLIYFLPSFLGLESELPVIPRRTGASTPFSFAKERRACVSLFVCRHNATPPLPLRTPPRRRTSFFFPIATASCPRAHTQKEKKRLVLYPYFTYYSPPPPPPLYPPRFYQHTVSLSLHAASGFEIQSILCLLFFPSLPVTSPPPNDSPMLLHPPPLLPCAQPSSSPPLPYPDRKKCDLPSLYAIPPPLPHHTPLPSSLLS